MDDYKNKFKILEEHIKEDFSAKVYMKYDINDECFVDLKTIFISKNNSWKNRFYALLHEVGHLIVNQNEEEKLVRYIDDNRRACDKYKAIKILNEEFDAWNEGRIYVEEKLNIKVNLYYYDKLKTKYLFSYIFDCLDRVYGKKIDISRVNRT